MCVSAIDVSLNVTDLYDIIMNIIALEPGIFKTLQPFYTCLLIVFNMNLNTLKMLFRSRVEDAIILYYFDFLPKELF